MQKLRKKYKQKGIKIKKIKKELKKDREEIELKRIEDIEAVKNDSRRMFQAVRVLNKKEAEARLPIMQIFSESFNIFYAFKTK